MDGSRGSYVMFGLVIALSVRLECGATVRANQHHHLEEERTMLLMVSGSTPECGYVFGMPMK
jgi:hypothetical protein